MSASEGSGAVLMMEICADGVSQVVPVGLDGAPVETSGACPHCDFCCDASEGVAGLTGETRQVAYWREATGGRLPLATKNTDQPHSRPMPRGPPVLHITLLSMPQPSLIDQPLDGHKKRSDGRPFYEAASA